MPIDILINNEIYTIETADNPTLAEVHAAVIELCNKKKLPRPTEYTLDEKVIALEPDSLQKKISELGWEKESSLFNVSQTINDQLLQAVIAKDMKKIQHHLKEGADPNTTNSNGTSVIIIAAFQSNTEIIEMLMENKNTNINVKDKEGRNFLMILIEQPLFLSQENGDFLKKLQNTNFNFNHQNKMGDNLLFVLLKNRAQHFIRLKPDSPPSLLKQQRPEEVKRMQTLVSQLLALSVNPEIMNKTGKTLQSIIDKNDTLRASLPSILPSPTQPSAITTVGHT